MATFDELTASGSLGTQAEVWVKRPSQIRTSATTAVTIDTIAVPNNSGLLIESIIAGRQTTGNGSLGEHQMLLAINNAGTVTLIAGHAVNNTGNGNIWSNDNSGSSFLSLVVSGTNVLLTLTPSVTNQTDWQCLTTTRAT